MALPPSPARPAPADAPSEALRVAGLWLYPVKSLGGIAVDAARVGDLGLAGDRRWMLVDGTGRALTQREHAALARFATALDGDTVHVTGPDGATVSFAPPAVGTPRMRVHVFGDTLDAAPAPAAVSAWFALRLGMACTLVHLPNDVVRPVDPAYAGPGDRTAFSDGYPVLVATQASLNDLNARLAADGEPPVPIGRFRPNLLVDGGAPWAEDDWRTVQAGEVALELVKPCARCVVTTIDPVTATRGYEPLRTLAAFRRHGGKVLFAQNAVVRAAGWVRVGDAVRAQG
jgi:hypothetical protein